MKGRIERIFENKKKDGNKYWVLLIDGERYSVWDQALMENLNERYFVEFEYRQSGKYKNITSIKKADDYKGPRKPAKHQKRKAVDA